MCIKISNVNEYDYKNYHPPKIRVVIPVLRKSDIIMSKE